VLAQVGGRELTVTLEAKSGSTDREGIEPIICILASFRGLHYALSSEYKVGELLFSKFT